MCGRFTLIADTEEFAATLGLQQIDFAPGPRYNIAPTQEVSTVLNDRRRAVVGTRWGLIPSWAQDPAIGARMINARAETLAEKPSFKRPLAKQRCLVLADGFYEWQPVPGRRAKTPHYIRLKTQQPFGFAGLWDLWHDPDGEPLRTCTIITTKANELLKSIHPRMPVICPPDRLEQWLQGEPQDPASLLPLLQPYPPDEMEAYAVTPRVNKVSMDDPSCVAPAE